MMGIFDNIGQNYGISQNIDNYVKDIPNNTMLYDAISNEVNSPKSFDWKGFGVDVLDSLNDKKTNYSQPKITGFQASNLQIPKAQMLQTNNNSNISNLYNYLR